MIAGITAVVAVLSIIVALLLPREFAAEARVLQPERSPLSLFGVAGSQAGGLSSLLMGTGGAYTRYLAILSSHSMMQETVDRFDLVEVYRLSGKPHADHRAIEKLRKNLDFKVDHEYNFLAVRAYDRDPERAAALSNHLVHSLNRRNSELSSENARQTRLFIEARLNQAMTDLDSVRLALQVFQEEHGVVELESQAQAFMQAVALRRGEAAQLEVQYQALAAQYGPDNPRVRAVAEALRTARAQVSGAIGGHEALMPVALRNLPALSRRYAELMQDQIIQARVIETIYPLYEQAMFQERNEHAAVQVVDDALPPVRAARPSRRLIVAAATLSGLALACMFVLMHAWLWRSRHEIAWRLRKPLDVSAS